MVLPFAVTVNVPDPVGPVSHVSTIVSEPAGAGVGVTANAVAVMARAPAPARKTAAADFKIDIVILLPEQPIGLFRPERWPGFAGNNAASRPYS
jgi:hypothetical protein